MTDIWKMLVLILKEKKNNLFRTQESFRLLNIIFIKGSKIILLVYDLTRRNSLEQLNYYYKEAMECVYNKEIVLDIIRNKCDLYEETKVSLMKVIFSSNK